MFLSAATLLPINNLDLFTMIWIMSGVLFNWKSLALDESHVNQCYIRINSTGISRQARERYLLHDPSQNYLTFEWLAHLRLCHFTAQNISEKKNFIPFLNSDNMCVNSHFISMYDICRKSRNENLKTSIGHNSLYKVSCRPLSTFY